MWAINSPFPKKNDNSSIALKSSFSEKIKDNSNNLISEISFNTPIKEINNLEENNNISPFKLNFNYYLKNFPSPGLKQKNPINKNIFNSFTASPNKNKLFQDINKDYYFIRKVNESPSFIIPPDSLKENINSNNSCYTFKSYNNFCSSKSQMKFSNNNIDENNLTKKNLSIIFNKENSDDYENKIIENKEKIGDKQILNDNKNNLFGFNFNSPIIYKNKTNKIFECSGSTLETFSPISIGKKRRLRKSERQLFILKKFYSENKIWNKNQIKELSSKIGIKENKVYKWLWDQRNKNAKNNIFIINKKKEKNGNSNSI